MDCNCPQEPNTIPIYDVNDFTNESGKYYLLQNDITVSLSDFFEISDINNTILDLNNYEITGSQTSPVIAITARDCNEITIKNGRINNTLTGLAIEQSSNIYMENLNIENCTQEGILASFINNLYLKDIRCSNNAGVGIKSFYTNNSHLENITVTGNGDEGIKSRLCDYLYMDKIVSKENATDNIDFDRCNQVYINDANSTYAGDDGIDFTSTNAVISNSFIMFSHKIDVKLEEEPVKVIARNCVYGVETPDVGEIIRVSTLDLKVTDYNGIPVMDAEIRINSMQDINPEDNGLRYLLRTDYKGEVSTDVTYLKRKETFDYLGPFIINIIHPDYQQTYFAWDAYSPSDEIIMLWPMLSN